MADTKIFNKKNLYKILFLVFIAVFFFVFFYFRLNRYFTYENIENVKRFILGYSILGPALLFLLYIVFNLAIMPTFYFILISSYLYGPWYGFLIGWLGMTAGLAASFLNSRYCFRQYFNRKFGGTKMFMELDSITRKYHGWAVLFFRIFFIIPYNFQNVAYGLTSIKFRTYLAGSATGILPTTVLYVWLGYLLSENRINLSNLKEISLFIFLIISLFGCIFFVSLYFRKKLKMQSDGK